MDYIYKLKHLWCLVGENQKKREKGLLKRKFGSNKQCLQGFFQKSYVFCLKATCCELKSLYIIRVNV